MTKDQRRAQFLRTHPDHERQSGYTPYRHEGNKAWRQLCRMEWLHKRYKAFYAKETRSPLYADHSSLPAAGQRDIS